MKIKQICEDNTGIEKNQFLPGYREDDAINFDESGSLHVMHECVAKIIDLMPNIKSVLDVGAGAGSMCYFLRKLNPSIMTVTLDGNQETYNSPFIEPERHFVVRTDKEYNLTEENNKTSEFDLICSFEHFEHIQPHLFVDFLDNLKKHSHDDTLMWATAAAYKFEKEHEKHVHCNVQSYDEWISLLNRNGFEVLNFSPFRENASLIHESWLPPHGRLACSYEFFFKKKKVENEK